MADIQQGKYRWLESTGPNREFDESYAPWSGLPWWTINWHSRRMHDVFCPDCGKKSTIPISWGDDGTCHKCQTQKESARRQQVQQVLDQSRMMVKDLFASKKRRSGTSVFDAHLQPVVDLVYKKIDDPFTMAVAYWHDALEDLDVPRDVLLAKMTDLDPALPAAVLLLTEQGEKKDWEGRKKTYLSHIPDYTWQVLLVSLCDKIASGRDFVQEWKNGDYGSHPDRVLWFYHEVSKAYATRATELKMPSFFEITLRQLDAIVTQMESLRK